MARVPSIRLHLFSRAAALLAVATVATIVSPALSAEPSAREKARAILAQAAKLYRSGDLKSALEQFRSAYEIFPSPAIFYNFALAHEGLGQPAQAVAALEHFLEGAKDAERDLRTDARKRLQRLSKVVGFASLTCNAADAEAFLDGVSIGPIAGVVRLPVNVGPHDLVVRSQGLGSRSLKFTAASGQTVPLTIQFQGSGPTAPAGVPDAAEELVRKGVELRKQRKHLEAYDYFRRAHEMSPLPRPTAQLGLVEYQLGKWVDAETHLEQSLRSPADPFISENRQTIAEALDVVRSHIGFLAVKGNPAGAAVSVNDRPAGTLPVSGLIKVSEGYVEVTVSAAGWVTAHRTLKIEPALTQELFVALEPQPGGGVAGVAPGGTSNAAIDVGRGAEAPHGGLNAWRATGIAVALGGLAAAGYGAYQTYQVQKLNHEVRQDNRKGVASGRTAERQQWLGYGLAAAGVGLGSLFIWLGGRDRSDSAAVSLSAAPDLFLLSLSFHR